MSKLVAYVRRELGVKVNELSPIDASWCRCG